MLAMSPEDHPCAGQITGNEPDVMAAAAEALCDHGYDAVDLNFACPVRKALSRERGGFLLQRPQLAGEIVRAVIKASGKPVTIKLRRGFADEPDETDEAGEPNGEVAAAAAATGEHAADGADAPAPDDDGADAFWAIAEEAFAAGAAAITVHARSVEARYRGRADWDFLTEVKQRFPDRTVIGSGDVMTAQAALDLVSRTGVDAAAVARGALGNPWIFRQILDLVAGRPPYRPTLAEQRAVMEEHFAGAVELYGPQRGPRIMRKHSIKYARLHPKPKTVRTAMACVRNTEQWHSVLDQYYSNDIDTAPVAAETREG
jgi:tRNA-dihydrouridine synthase